MCKVDVMMSSTSNDAGLSDFGDVSPDVIHGLLVKKGSMAMTLDSELTP